MPIDFSQIADFESFRANMIQKLHDKSQDRGSLGCRLWLMGKYNGYGGIYYTFKRKDGSVCKGKAYAHRISYMLHHNTLEIDSRMQCSHLCGQPLCINPDHICIEDGQTNTSRIPCHQRKICSQNHEPHCIV